MFILYNDEENKDLIKLGGKQKVDRDDLMELVRNLPIREKAICLVNLITANRPSEMVALKIKDFELENNSVSIYMKKQKSWHEKRLTQESTKAVKDYINRYKLKEDDYFVGRVYKNGRYESVKSFRRSI
ncbi:tyrosine-type recombinase/integrase [Pseudogracilibacillus sp. SO30301A]|uniref:tyrosine-type recombinase/integrase n=1 Tax=Pseudogracilibacillus sp. SO30301A TaxID=3098291 RepID=UPI00300DCB9B